MLGIERGSCGPVFTALAFAALLVVSPASSQSPVSTGAPARVVLFSKDPPDPLVRRVGAELHSLGFDVVTAPDDETPKSAGQMESTAQSSDAVAAVRVAIGDTSVDLWIVNVRTHEMLLRRVAAGKDPAVTALRSVEALRVSLIDLQALLPPPPEPEPVTKLAEPHETIVPIVPVARRNNFGFELGLGAASGMGGFDPSMHAVGQVQWLASTHWSAQVLGVAPITSSKVSAGEGSAHVTFGVLGVGATWQPLAPNEWTPYLGAGVGGVLLYTRGAPSPGFVGHSQVDITAAPYARAGSSFAVGASLRLTADLLAAVAAPEPVVYFENRRASAWGRPLVLGTVGVEVLVQ
jgi:hypothetical protein